MKADFIFSFLTKNTKSKKRKKESFIIIA
ncbi:hypothetical protein NC652_015270 [Populus alba x Populus x berolinensis]|uniref:Uncharacterized protein n=1 Tax=Populus alba x Populus x berolinensis TaxID=444605 RepID=A0AAD6QK03_9ROSI|nr:hypothetical protein NC652_015270 [Populus alba x Populus x berolinensis]KAJ6991841.1 hypothetical protein NC653_015249 [Populus alba x Populus x berolinensis]